jgi:hypothetical protein
MPFKRVYSNYAVLCNIQETPEIIADPISAGTKPSRWKPEINVEISQNKSALRINENNPKVMRLIGSVSIVSTGRMVRPNIPQIIATTTAVYKLSTWIPGTNFEMISSVSAVTRTVMSARINIVLS